MSVARAKHAQPSSAAARPGMGENPWQGAACPTGNPDPDLWKRPDLHGRWDERDNGVASIIYTIAATRQIRIPNVQFLDATPLSCRDRDGVRVRTVFSPSFSIPMAIPIPIPTRATRAADRAPRHSSPCRTGMVPVGNLHGMGSRDSNHSRGMPSRPTANATIPPTMAQFVSMSPAIPTVAQRASR